MPTTQTSSDALKAQVREKYEALARGGDSGCGCGSCGCGSEAAADDVAYMGKSYDGGEERLPILDSSDGLWKCYTIFN